MTEVVEDSIRLIDLWFPCAAVDEACQTPAGSGRSEKSIFTWFASRPIAQARAAVACALFGNDILIKRLVERAVRGDGVAIRDLSDAVANRYPAGHPVVLDVFSGRGIIPLEAARLGATSVGLDSSPVATLAGRLLADYPFRDWSKEPTPPWRRDPGDALDVDSLKPKLIADLETLLEAIDRRIQEAMAPFYPRNLDGSLPWGYLWAISIPCDGCGRRFPLIGDLVLRHPCLKSADSGQSLYLEIDGDNWAVTVIDSVPKQQPTYSNAELATGKKRKGKNARCLFCQHVHSLEAVKAKGASGQYRDEILIAADHTNEKKGKTFRVLRPEERDAVHAIDISNLAKFGDLSAVPDEAIPENNVHTVMASGYGYRSFGDLMCARQTLQFVETARAIREYHLAATQAGCSNDYARTLASYAAAIVMRRLRHSTRGARIRSHGSKDGASNNRVQIDHIFANEASINFQFDWFEAGPGLGPGTWESVSSTGMSAISAHLANLSGRPARFRLGNAMALPYRDGSVDAVITDPPYYDMIEYADASDLFYVWLKRILFDIEPDLFGPNVPTQAGLQNKNDEIIVRRVQEPGRIRHDEDFYEASLSKAFAEARRVLRLDGHLVVVFGHSDPDAWKRLLGALHDAGFVVTSSWPSRTESANTGVASIKVTVTIGCRVALNDRVPATAAEVDRLAAEAVKIRVATWTEDGLALVDQMMAAYGPVMEVYGRFSKVLQPDGDPAPLERYLTLARRAVREATALRLDEIPLETFDALTRFAVFWMRLYGRTSVPKGEARFLAQADNLRLEDVRGSLLVESAGGFKLLLDAPVTVDANSAAFDVVRALGGAYAAGGAEAAADVLARSERAVDEEHLWAVVGELVAQLPAADDVAKNLAAVQRNASVIRNLAKGMVIANEEREKPREPTLFDVEKP